MRLQAILMGYFVLVGATEAQTARQYFNEIKATNNQTHVLDHFKDQYVCFRDDDQPSFAIIARSEQVVEHMKKAGMSKEAEQIENSDMKHVLFVETYYKGVRTGDQVYEPVGAEGTDFRIVFKSPFSGRMVYSFNFATWRYRLQIFHLDKNKILFSSGLIAASD